MADSVLPSVRILLPCDDAIFDLADQAWSLKNPLGTLQLPSGATFPYRVENMAVYAQFVGGLGAFDVAVEMLRWDIDGSKKLIGTSAVTRYEFFHGQQLLTLATAFQLKMVPFRFAGIYEFRAVATTAGRSQLLSGQSAELRVLDRRSTV